MIDYHAFQQIHHLRDQDKLTLAQIARALPQRYSKLTHLCSVRLTHLMSSGLAGFFLFK
jgi:hypothetical protein